MQTPQSFFYLIHIYLFICSGGGGGGSASSYLSAIATDIYIFILKMQIFHLSLQFLDYA